MHVNHGSRFNPALLQTPVMMRTIDTLTEGRRWWAVLTEANGTQHEAFPGATPGEIVTPHEAQAMFARDMGAALNRHLHHDGAWIVVLVGPQPGLIGLPWVEYRGFMFVFLDRDGDPAFVIENDEPWWRVLAAGPDTWLEQAEAAWIESGQFLRDTETPKGAIYRPAQGERRPSQR